MDFIKKWNLVYGKDGFICYQCVFPLKESKIAIKKILFLMHKHRLYSFVSVIKLLGKNDGSISFGIKGFTIAFDFPKSEKYEVFLKDMDKAVEAIINSKDSGNKLMIFGDYDVDGVSSTAMLYNFFN